MCIILAVKNKVVVSHYIFYSVDLQFFTALHFMDKSLLFVIFHSLVPNVDWLRTTCILGIINGLWCQLSSLLSKGEFALFIHLLWLFQEGGNKTSINVSYYIFYTLIFWSYLFIFLDYLMEMEFVSVDRIYVFCAWGEEEGACKLLYPLHCHFILFTSLHFMNPYLLFLALYILCLNFYFMSISPSFWMFLSVTLYCWIKGLTPLFINLNFCASHYYEWN